MPDFAFNEFPTVFDVPGHYVEYSNAANQPATTILPQKLLLLGQMLDTGVTAPEVPVLVTDPDQAGQLVGRGSMLHHMAIGALKAARGAYPVWLMPLEDADGAVASDRDITLAGPSTAAGTLALYVGGRRYGVNIASGVTAAAAAALVVTAINADDLRLVDAAAVGAVVTLTARNAGIDAGKISAIVNRYSDERLPAGITCAIGALTAGSGNPVLTSSIAALQNLWYPTFAMPYTDGSNLAAFVAELERRNGPIPQIEGVAFCGVDDTVQNLLTFADARNNPFFAPVDAADYLSPPYQVGAVCAAVGAASAQNDPAIPEQGDALPELVAVAEGARRTIADRNLLLAGGVGTTTTDEAGVSRAERFTTSYRKNSAGVTDRSRFDVCHTRIWAQTRFGLRLWFNKFSKFKLGKDGSLGARVMTPSLARSQYIAFYKSYVDQGWFEGGIAFETFKQQVAAQISSTDANRLNGLFPADFMNQLRVIGTLVQPVG